MCNCLIMLLPFWIISHFSNLVGTTFWLIELLPNWILWMWVCSLAGVLVSSCYTWTLWVPVFVIFPTKLREGILRFLLYHFLGQCLVKFWLNISSLNQKLRFFAWEVSGCWIKLTTLAILNVSHHFTMNFSSDYYLLMVNLEWLHNSNGARNLWLSKVQIKFEKRWEIFVN